MFDYLKNWNVNVVTVGEGQRCSDNDISDIGKKPTQDRGLPHQQQYKLGQYQFLVFDILSKDLIKLVYTEIKGIMEACVMY